MRKSKVGAQYAESTIAKENTEFDTTNYTTSIAGLSHVWGDGSGSLHEKVDPVLLEMLRQVLEPIRTEAEYQVKLERDREFTWFGFDRDSSGHPAFVNHERFATIMTETLVGKVVERFPQPVSSIRETDKLILFMSSSLGVSAISVI
ncbi:hypothetical protein EV127DRAFT_412783 [Xylaria flabelliformis]|nr:hypothetical protein EV127DRAFT_412783 [Xylaria flabelliformis]